MKTKIAIVLALIVTVVFTQQQSEETTVEDESKLPLRLGIYNGDSSLLAIVALEQGIFSKNGLDITRVNYSSGRDAMEAMLNNEVDFATSAEFVAVKHSFTRDDFRILASISQGDINQLIIDKTHGIKEISDLQGKRIGVVMGSAAEYFLGILLSQHHVPLSAITMVDGIPSELNNNLKNSSLGAVFTWEPNIYNLQRDEPERYQNFPMPSGFPFRFLLITNQLFLQKNSTVANRILLSLQHAADWIATNPQQLRSKIPQWLPYDATYIDYTLQRHKLELELPYSLLPSMELQAQWLIRNSLVPTTEIPNLSALIDSSYLQSLQPNAVKMLQ